jgi:hypothetical protein
VDLGKLLCSLLLGSAAHGLCALAVQHLELGDVNAAISVGIKVIDEVFAWK